MTELCDKGFSLQIGLFCALSFLQYFSSLQKQNKNAVENLRSPEKF